MRAENATPCAWFPVRGVNMESILGKPWGILTCGASDNTSPPLLLVQMSHLIVRPAELEAEDREEILPLEKDAAFEAIA